MPNAFKPVVARNTGTSPVTLYTAPASTQSVVFSGVLANTWWQPITVDVWTVIGGSVTYLAKGASIPAGTQLLLPKVALVSGDSIRAQSSVASSLDATLSVLEIS